MRNAWIIVAAAGLALMANGCAWITKLVSTEIVVVSSTRSLRQQVLGVYDQVGEEVYSLAGVRAVDPVTGQATAPPPMTESERRVLAARRRMEFNRDDVHTFMQRQYVGEANTGTLEFFEDHKARLEADDPWLYALIAEIVAQENEDREAILQRIMAVTPQLAGENGEQDARAILADRYRMEAQPGTRVQLSNGDWQTKGK